MLCQQSCSRLCTLLYGECWVTSNLQYDSSVAVKIPPPLPVEPLGCSIMMLHNRTRIYLTHQQAAILRMKIKKRVDNN